MVRTQRLHGKGPGSVLGWGTQIPQAAPYLQKKKIMIIIKQREWFFKNNFIYYIFGCAGSSMLCRLFSSFDK